MLENINVYRSSSGEQEMESVKSVRRSSAGERQMEIVERLEWKKFLPNDEVNDEEEEDEGDEWTKLRGDKWDEL